MNKFARIIGTGGYLPPKVITNDDLTKHLDTSDAWITTRTGIKQRHYVEHETATDLAVNASKRALEMANIGADRLDLIIVATTTPDKIFPSTASMLQHQLAAHCPAFDIQAVCAGFIYALAVAEQFIKNGHARHTLIVGSETLSKIIDPHDRSTAVLFGDGAGAVILSAHDEIGILHTQLHTDGSYLNSLHVSNEDGFIKMTGNEVFRVAVNKLSVLARETLDACHISGDDLDWMIPHQANIRIINAVADRINLPISKVVITVDKHANTSAASIPLALDEAVRDGRVQAKDYCLFEGIGAGFAWGSALLRF